MFSYFVAAPLAESSVAGRMLVLIASALGLTAIVIAIEYLLLLWWTAPFKGDWYYHSSSEHFAHMRFSVRKTEIFYRVQTYDLPGIVGVVTEGRSGRSGKADQMGYAESRHITYDGADLLQILYEYSEVGGAGGMGFLRISGADGSDAMTGAWMTARSTIESQSAKPDGSGRLKVFRPDRFRTFLEAHFQDELRSEGLDVNA